MEAEHPARISDDAVREELNRILASHEFRSSKRSQDFLRYVVENTLAGHSGILKERTIGIEVFGRSVSYDPSDDATVRVKAGEVRKRLGLYYASQGAHDRLRIDLPGGTYVPEFRAAPVEGGMEAAHPAAHSAAHSPDVTAAADTAPATPGPAPAPRMPLAMLVAGLALVTVCTLGAIFFAARSRQANSTLEQFWAPVLQGTAPLSLCAAYVPVYSLDRDASSKQPLRAEDFTLLTDQFVGGGDLAAISRLSAMLTRMKRPYRMRIGNDVSFTDLRTAPAILVGYSYTRWKEISRQMRFFIDGSRKPIGVTDNGAPTRWALPNLPADRRTGEDYAIVSRVFHPDTHAMLVELAGITQYGTEAAADLVTTPDLIAEALRGAPAGWPGKNLQLVLHVKVISGAPTSPRIVAAYFW